MTQTSNPDPHGPHPPHLLRGVAARPAQALRRRRRPHHEPRRRRALGGVPRRRGLLRPLGAPLPRPDHRSRAQAAGRRLHRPGGDPRPRAPRPSTTASASSATPPSRSSASPSRASRSARSIAPPKANLAATAALEHFTATLAELLLTERGDPRHVRPRRGAQPLRLARPRGVRAQGGGVRRLQGRRRHRADAGVDDEVPPLRLRGRHGAPGRSSRCSSTGAPTGRATCGPAGSGSARRRSCIASSGTSCATTTVPTSTPTTATPPRSSSSGAPSSSAPRARSTTSSPPSAA